MARKAATPKKELKSRFVIIRQDCANVEGTEDTLEKALGFVQDKLEYDNWDIEDMGYVRILEVVAVHSVTVHDVISEPTDLNDIY